MSQKTPSALNTRPEVVHGDWIDTTGRGLPYQLGDQIRVVCDHGYTPPQTVTSTVILDQGVLRWEPERLVCQPVACPVPPFLAHARHNTSQYTFPEKFHYVCDAGYVFNGPVRDHFCMPSGDWNPPLSKHMRCDPVECPPLQAPAHGFVQVLHRLFGAVARYQCHPNYGITQGDAERVCQKDGTWSGEEPTCELPTCPAMDPSVRVLHRDQNTHYVDCGKGIPVPVKCLPGGQWSIPHPHCPGTNPPTVAQPLPAAPVSPTVPKSVPSSMLSFPKVLILFCLILILISFFL